MPGKEGFPSLPNVGELTGAEKEVIFLISCELAGFIRKTEFEALPGAAVHMARLAFLDWLGSAAAGGRQPPFQKVLAVIRGQGGTPQATLLATGEKTSCLNAALGNGVASHIVELDDVHRGSILHAGASVIPAALAVAEMTGAGGRELLAAIVAGYEVAVRVGEAVTPSHYYFWHTTGTCGTFGDVDCAAGQRPCLDVVDAHGFLIDEAEVLYWGLCPTCQAAAKAP